MIGALEKASPLSLFGNGPRAEADGFVCDAVFVVQPDSILELSGVTIQTTECVASAFAQIEEASPDGCCAFFK